MKLDKEFFVSLIEQKEPLKVIWNELNKIWEFPKLTKKVNIEDEYIKREKKTCEFEHILSKIFFEIYNRLIENINRNIFLKDIIRDSQWTVIIMDGLSIREANFLFKTLKHEKYIIDDYFYSFSTLPSDTQSFAKRFFKVSTPSQMLSKKKLGFRFIQVARKEDIERIPKKYNRLLIWTIFPDTLLHSKEKGRVEVLSLKDPLEKTKEVIHNILERLEIDEVLLTSDHGYLYFPEYGTWWDTKYEKVLRKILGNDRSKSLDNLSGDKRKVINKLLSDMDENCLDVNKNHVFVKGRYFWSAPGRFSPIIHGGLSLMECLVPTIILRRV